MICTITLEVIDLFITLFDEMYLIFSQYILHPLTRLRLKIFDANYFLKGLKILKKESAFFPPSVCTVSATEIMITGLDLS